MNYIIYDLEFNQKSSKDAEDFGMPFEIIQIGAVKLDENLNHQGNFNALVKPTLYTEIHPYIENLTNITTDAVNSNKTFSLVYDDFLKFVGHEDFVSCIWGTGDIKEFVRNIKFHKLNLDSLSKKYIDIQALASKHFNAPKGTKVGLSKVVESFNLPITGDFHDAFNDAYYTSQIFKKLFTPDIKPSLYDFNFSYRASKVASKHKIDTVSLFKQLEKMYNRKLTEDEKSMVKLAYIMGKTNQFLL